MRLILLFIDSRITRGIGVLCAVKALQQTAEDRTSARWNWILWTSIPILLFSYLSEIAFTQEATSS